MKIKNSSDGSPILNIKFNYQNLLLLYKTLCQGKNSILMNKSVSALFMVGVIGSFCDV